MRSDRRPILCLVTDRHRLCGACDNAAARRCLIAQIGHAVDAGVDLVQIRERGLETSDLAALVAAAVDIARGSPTEIVVNDRLDVALACGAAGVHLRADSIPPSAVRTMAPRGFLVGRSVHDAHEAARAGADVDYLIAGTVYPTASKPGAGRLLGPTGLAEVTREARVPVLAIGGVTIERLAEVATAGAAGAAAIGLFLHGDPSIPCGGRPLRSIVAAARASFDAPRIG